MTAAFKRYWKFYLMEALGLAIFMISACLFAALLEGHTTLHTSLKNAFARMVIMGVLMGATALFIFYSPATSPSGSHINPAVTITLWRLGKIDKWNALFYILFQFIGGTVAVYLMAGILKGTVTGPPVNYATTVPGKAGVLSAFMTESVIAFIMMTMNLFTSSNNRVKKYTRIIAACFVCLYVIIAGPVSGFGMNPARSFASAFPSHIWTAFWIYLFVPVGSMLLAAECFLYVEKRKQSGKYTKALQQYLKSNPSNPK